MHRRTLVVGTALLVLALALVGSCPTTQAQTAGGKCGVVVLRLDNRDVDLFVSADFIEGDNCGIGDVEIIGGPGVTPEEGSLDLEITFDLDKGTMSGVISGEWHYSYQLKTTGVRGQEDGEYHGRIGGKVYPGEAWEEGTWWVFEGWIDLSFSARVTEACE